jgi:hypothetical protein
LLATTADVKPSAFPKPGNWAVFLATVDDRVSAAASRRWAQRHRAGRAGAAEKVEEACYSDSADVIAFRDFFREQVRQRRPSLIIA